MTPERFNAFCARLTATSHVVQWGGADVWKVAGKVFAVGGWDTDRGPAFTFKTSVSDFHFLSEEPGYRPAPYFASRGMSWIQCVDAASLPAGELEDYLVASHRLVAAGLSRKARAEHGLD
ncbi:MAG: MmcQ/YjbR family DNA-binding protein [Pseudomonadota bacterium]